MIIDIVALNKVKEGKKEEFIRLAQELIQKSLAEEGCIFYDLYEDMKEPNTLTFIEKWQNEEAIASHNNSKHFTSIVPLLGQLVEEKEVRVYKAT
jgi:quinol monooxygenase YgiN